MARTSNNEFDLASKTAIEAAASFIACKLDGLKTDIAVYEASHPGRLAPDMIHAQIRGYKIAFYAINTLIRDGVEESEVLKAIGETTEDESDLKDRCVYVHLFPDGKKYIGMTHTAKLYDRWKGGEGYITNKKMYAAILKCGWDNIVHEVVQDHLTEREARILESNLINKYRTANPEEGYNVRER